MFLLFLFNLYRCLIPDFNCKYTEKYKLDYCTIYPLRKLDIHVILLITFILFMHVTTCVIKKCMLSQSFGEISTARELFCIHGPR